MPVNPCHWSRAARPNRLSWDYFNVLTGQGANAPGGAARYIVHGKMIGGFDWSRGRQIKAIPG